jgi:hypothetical protein
MIIVATEIKASVVIPTKNSDSQLRGVLEALMSQITLRLIQCGLGIGSNE